MGSIEVHNSSLEKAIQAQRREIARERENRIRSPQLFEAGLDTIDIFRILETQSKKRQA